MASHNGLAAALLAGFLLSGCGSLSPGSRPGPGTSLSQPELKYRVIDRVGNPWYCDRDLYPVARGDEQAVAVAQFPQIKADAGAYKAIAGRLHLVGVEPNDQQKLAIYREWKTLEALQLLSGGDRFRFSVLVRAPGDKSALQVEGSVDQFGAVKVDGQQAAGPPSCPICLAASSRIDTPQGAVPVTQLVVGSPVWTLDGAGHRIVSTVVRAGSVVAPAGHEVVALILSDGRHLDVSPGHPSADGRRVGGLRAGDLLDGSVVVSVARRPYTGSTYDLLPEGPTGVYWANGILLGSTLTTHWIAQPPSQG